MESSSFYLTLPSNASYDVYPNNSPWEYKIHLPRTLYLPDNYEVALAEIHYPHTWHTFRNTEDYRVTYQSADVEFKVVNIPRGFYKDIDDLIDNIHKELRQSTGIQSTQNLPLRFGYVKVTRTVILRIKPGFQVTLGRGLGEMFGFKADTLFKKNQTGFFPADINHGFYSLFVYCNICEPQIVGDYYVPLLRAVKIEGEDGDQIIKTFNQPHYVPVNMSKFDVIEINIKDDLNEFVSFTIGKVICKLHFRPKAF